MEILNDILDVNFSISTKLQLYISLFFVITTIILFLHIKPIVNKLNNKTPFYWFVGLIGINMLNIVFTYYHYNMRSNTFYGSAGPHGDPGDTGMRGEYTRCAKCDELISLDIHRRYDLLQNIYVDGITGQVRRPFTKYGFSSLGDMIVTENIGNSKQCYVVSGPKVKKPEDYSLIIKIPIIKGKISKPLYIWRPIPPSNYVAMGDLITDNKSKPPLDACACLPQDCLRPIDNNVGYSSWKFLYQNMRPGKEEDYIFCSFWDTPLNTFHTNFPDFQEKSNRNTFKNGNLFYNMVDGNPTFIKFNKVEHKYIPIKSYEDKFTALFKSIISPLDLKGNRQNIGGTGHLIKENKNVTTLWDAIQHYFPGNYRYMISIDSTGDVKGGARLNKQQKKLIKYIRVWITPNRPMYVIHNKCLSKERISVEKKESIMRIKQIYDDINTLMYKYAENSQELRDYLENHFNRLMRQMRHLPDFHRNVIEHDFIHFGENRLKTLETELKNIHQAILNMTNEVQPERREKYFNLIKALKNYDNVKLNFDKTLVEKSCPKNKITEIEKEFQSDWSKIRMLYLANPNYKKMLKNRDFDGISDSKLEKTTDYFNSLSDNLSKFANNSCK